jgi:gluconolactonase
LYRFDPANGSLTLVADDFQGPNGLCFSPDETRLYVVETGLQFAIDPVQHIRVFDMSDDGTRLRGGDVFHTISVGAADGIRADSEGNIWSSAGDGVHCIDAGGLLLGKILVPSTVSNLAFGDRNLSRLFICAGRSLYAIYVNKRGDQLP